MKSISDLRCYPPKRTDDRTELLSHGDGKGKPSSWQRSVKRKLPSSAFELLPQARKPDNTLFTSQGPHRPIASVRKSLSDPLQVFGDCDESNNSNQHRSLSGSNPSDCKDRSLKDEQGRNDSMEDVENLSRSKRRGLKLGLKDSTNLDPKVALKQNSLHTYKEVLALKEALRIEKEAHLSLQAELDEERNAASSAANETMSMIARLQEEKAAVLMEARQFKRMAEERELHNQEAISLLKEMLMNKEEEAFALENELVACRQMFLAIEAGEPIQNLKYLDMEMYGKRNLETGLVSCDSKQLTVYANDLSRGTLEEEPINSEFNGRKLSRSFKGFASENIRGNLEAFFDQAGKSSEGIANCNDVQCKEEVFEAMHDSVLNSSMSVNVQESSFNLTQSAIHRFGEGGRVEQMTPSSIEKAFSECQTEPLPSCTDEQNRSLWDRIMKLEHRLEMFGVDKQGFEFDLSGNVATTPHTPAFTTCKQQVSASCWEMTSRSTLNSQEVEMKMIESAERPRKLQSTGGSQGDTEISLRQNQTHASFESPTDTSEQSCEVASDMVEGVHDVYEVGYESNQGSHNCISPGVDTSRKDQPASLEKPDSPLELIAPVMETMALTPPDSAAVRNMSSSLSGAEVQQLSMRLQVLENEKHSMHQAILSLQAENKELKTLQGVALQLQELKQSQNLKRSLQTLEQPNKRVKSEQSSFTSLLRGFFSYLPSGSNAENRSMPAPSQDLGSDLSAQKDYVGLSHLLEKSPHLKSDTLIVRGLKVKVPAAI